MGWGTSGRSLWHTASVCAGLLHDVVEDIRRLAETPQLTCDAVRIRDDREQLHPSPAWGGTPCMGAVTTATLSSCRAFTTKTTGATVPTCTGTISCDPTVEGSGPAIERVFAHPDIARAPVTFGSPNETREGSDGVRLAVDGKTLYVFESCALAVDRPCKEAPKGLRAAVRYLAKQPIAHDPTVRKSFASMYSPTVRVRRPLTLMSTSPYRRPSREADEPVERPEGGSSFERPGEREDRSLRDHTGLTTPLARAASKRARARVKKTTVTVRP